MTLAIAWVRNAGINQELVFISDSRLNGGGNVDECQKIFSLPRDDCCITFSGETRIAYPFIHQLQNVTADYKKSLDRAIDITKFKRMVVDLLNSFIAAHKGTVDGDLEKDLRKTNFLLGGWSWQLNKFFIWRLQFESSSMRYVAVSAAGVQPKIDRLQDPLIMAIGDYRQAFFNRIRSACANAYPDGIKLHLNYQPLFTLAGMLVEDEFNLRKGPKNKGLIGGAPQVTKVHKFMKTSFYAIQWQIGTDTVFAIKGRVLEGYETFSVLGMDPCTGGLILPRTFADLGDLTHRISDGSEAPIGQKERGFSTLY